MLIDPAAIPNRRSTNYPEPFRAAVAGRHRKRPGSAAGLKNFGVNLTMLNPGSQSALRYWHSHQDELIHVVRELMLVTDTGEQPMTAGAIVAFPAGEANGHHLVNRSAAQPSI